MSILSKSYLSKVFSRLLFFIFTQRPHGVVGRGNLNWRERSVLHSHHQLLWIPLRISGYTWKVWQESILHTCFLSVFPTFSEVASTPPFYRASTEARKPGHTTPIQRLCDCSGKTEEFWASVNGLTVGEQGFAPPKCMLSPQMSEGHTRLLREGNSSVGGENARFKVRLVREGAITDY